MQRIALVYGGESPEHSVSCVSALGVRRAIDSENYEVIEVGITRSGKFVLHPISDDWQLNANPEVPEDAPELIWPVGGGELRMASGISLGKIDLSFPVLHGPGGEDGSFQGLMQLCHIPYVGNGVMASALAMDKARAKSVFRDAGLRVTDDIRISRSGYMFDQAGALAKAGTMLDPDCFVKPARSGSSVGVTLVKNASDLQTAIELALSYDQTCLVEKRVHGREVECSVLEKVTGEIVVSKAGEIVVHGREFYDYEAKYLDGGAELKVPTDLTAAQLEELQELAVRAFEALGCQGLARTDFFLTDSGFVITEVNTMPGFTPISMYPALWQASGLSYQQLIEQLIQTGLAFGSDPR
jgi:D-alanine-D-alanine ligase